MQDADLLPLTPTKKVKAWSYAGLHVISGCFPDPSAQYVALACMSGHVLIYRLYLWTITRAIRVFDLGEAVARIAWSPSDFSIFCVSEHGSFTWVDLTLDIPIRLSETVPYPLRIYSTLPSSQQMENAPDSIYPVPSVIDEKNSDLTKAITDNPRKFVNQYVRAEQRHSRKRKSVASRISKKGPEIITSGAVFSSLHLNPTPNSDTSGAASSESNNGNLKETSDSFKIDDDEDEETEEESERGGRRELCDYLPFVNKNKWAVEEYDRKSEQFVIIRVDVDGDVECEHVVDSDIHFINGDEVLLVCGRYGPTTRAKFIHVKRYKIRAGRKGHAGDADGELTYGDATGGKEVGGEIGKGGKTVMEGMARHSTRYTADYVIKNLPIPSWITGEMSCLIKRFENYNKSPDVYHLLVNCRSYIMSYESNIIDNKIRVVGLWHAREQDKTKYRFIKGKFDSPITLICERSVFYFTERPEPEYHDEKKLNKKSDEEFVRIIKGMPRGSSAENRPHSGGTSDGMRGEMRRHSHESRHSHSEHRRTVSVPRLLVLLNMANISGVKAPFKDVSFSSGGDFMVLTKSKMIQIFDTGLILRQSYTTPRGNFHSATLLQEKQFEHPTIYDNYSRNTTSHVRDKYPSLMFTVRKSSTSVIVYSQNIPQSYSGLIKDFQQVDECKPLIEREDEHDHDPDEVLYSEEMFSSSKLFVKHLGRGLENLKKRILERVIGMGYYSSPPDGLKTVGFITPFNRRSCVGRRRGKGKRGEKVGKKEKIDSVLLGPYVEPMHVLPSQFRPMMPGEY